MVNSDTMIIILIAFLLITKCSWCLPLDQLYPFGPDENDRVLNSSSNLPTMDVYTNVFDSTSRQKIYVSLL